MSRTLSDDAPILVIDDDETMRRACAAALRRAGYPVEVFADGPSGLARIAEIDPALLVVDLKMPGMDGLEVIARARQTRPDLVAVVITGFATVSTAVEAMKAGAYDFIPKPFTAAELRVILDRALERRQLAREAERLRREKEAQTRKFITFVSHQLKSPLGAVQQYLDVLRYQAGEAIPPQYGDWIERCAHKVADMLQIIGDWMTIAKVEGGQLATAREPIRWPDVAAEVLDGAAEAANSASITLHNEVPGDLPAIIGDPVGLRMLLANLVNNAITYNRPGGEVRIAGEADERTVHLRVSDNGAGIAPENQERVFEEFYRVVGKSGGGKGGTGMGLPICRKIAEELGGRVTLESTLDAGSTFTVTLPRAVQVRAVADS